MSVFFANINKFLGFFLQSVTFSWVSDWPSRPVAQCTSRNSQWIAKSALWSSEVVSSILFSKLRDNSFCDETRISLFLHSMWGTRTIFSNYAKQNVNNVIIIFFGLSLITAVCFRQNVRWEEKEEGQEEERWGRSKLNGGEGDIAEEKKKRERKEE